MTSRDFCYWLQGFFEIENMRTGKVADLDADQVLCIKQHLALVFKHEIDPSMGPPEHQADLNKIHEAISKVDKKLDAHTKTAHGNADPHGLVMRC